MAHEFDEEAVLDLERMMAQEQEKEITQIATTQGQIAALVVMLRSRGVLSNEDVKRWEHESEEMASLIVSTLKAGEVAKFHEEVGEEREAISAQLDMMELTAEMSRRMGASDEQLQELYDIIRKGRAELEKEDSGTDRED